jgi:hypothetical protein
MDGDSACNRVAGRIDALALAPYSAGVERLSEIAGKLDQLCEGTVRRAILILPDYTPRQLAVFVRATREHEGSNVRLRQ